jgi:hypothetical protein
MVLLGSFEQALCVCWSDEVNVSIHRGLDRGTDLSAEIMIYVARVSSINWECRQMET